MNMKYLTKFFLALSGFGCAFGHSPAYAQNNDQFVIVVHQSSNLAQSDSSMMASIKQMYLKEKTKWSNGMDAVPFDRPNGSPVKVAFLQTVLGMSETQLAEHWISVKQKNGTSPPRVIPSSSLLLKFLERYPGSFAMMSREEAEKAADAVKIIFSFS